MEKDYLQIFNDSYLRCSDDPQFIDRFYTRFISSSEEVADKFKTTNMDVQKDMLLKSLAYMMNAHKRPNVLSLIASKHDKNHFDVPPHLYSVWLNCMIDAVEQTDPLFDKKIEEAWRFVMQPGIDYMVGRYEGA